MALKRLAKPEDTLVSIIRPISESELMERQADYISLTAKEFANKYRNFYTTPAELVYNGQNHLIQYNYCTNPFCRWFGLEQTRFGSIPNKPYRYRLTRSETKMLHCNPDPDNHYVASDRTILVSNWSIADEISRLVTINSVMDWEPQYEFHNEDCSAPTETPFGNQEYFKKRGKRQGCNSQRWQCKQCGKITNVLPQVEESFNYHQQRNDILFQLFKHLVNRTPVRRTCELLEISPSTYYDKLEWLYRRCLEFLSKHEVSRLGNMDFKELWLDTDQFVYYLNNVRRRGKGGIAYEHLDEPSLPTHVVVTGDLKSRYIFRADLAYDWFITLDDIQSDTVLYQEDALNEYARKNAWLRFSYCPQPPRTSDDKEMVDFLTYKQRFDIRKNYIDGIHVNATYTAIAHY